MKDEKKIEPSDVEFMTDTTAAMVRTTPIRYHMILWVSVAFMLIFLLWADNATLEEVTRGQGKVVPSSNMQIIQNLEGGIIKDIRIRSGDVVEQDQILMIIDDTRFASSFKEGLGQLNALKLKVGRLTAEVDGKDFVVPEDIAKNFPEIISTEKQLFQSRLNDLNVKLNLLIDQQNQRAQELKELQSRQDQLKRSYDLAKKEYDLTQPLVKDGAVSQVELLRLERQVNDLQGEYSANQLAMPRLQSALESAAKKIEEQKSEYRTKALGELNDAKSELSKISEQNTALEDRVNRTLVRSPVKGTVNQVKISTIGGIVQPGQDLIEIVPLEDSLLVEANVRPSDIGFLKPGLEAMVKLTAYDFAIYGGLKAEVERISADTITNEKGESFYQIHVRTKKNYILHNGKHLLIKPGMAVTVDIKTGEKTVLDYILKPILKTKQNALRER
jgi:adhesin transport system membrane fusion protein